MSNYKATPLTTTPPAKAKPQKEQAQKQEKILIISWDVHEKEQQTTEQK